MRLSRFYSIVAALFVIPLFFGALSCDVSDDKEYYKIVIFSYGDTFIGTYTIDSDFYVISSAEIEKRDGVYYYEKFLGSLTTLDVDVAGSSAKTSFIKVMLYQDKENVGNSSRSPGDGENSVAYVSFSYTVSGSGSD